MHLDRNVNCIVIFTVFGIAFVLLQIRFRLSEVLLISDSL